MSVGPYEQGQAYGAARIHLWLCGEAGLEPQFAPIWSWCLANNLATGAGLCRTFIEGCKQTAAAVAIEEDDYEVEPDIITRPVWVPGCGRSAP